MTENVNLRPPELRSFGMITNSPGVGQRSRDARQTGNLKALCGTLTSTDKEGSACCITTQKSSKLSKTDKKSL